MHCKAVTWRLLLNAKIQRTTASHLAASLCMLTTLSEIPLGFSQKKVERGREGRFHSSESNYEHILSYTSIILTMMMIQKKEIIDQTFQYLTVFSGLLLGAVLPFLQRKELQVEPSRPWTWA